MAVEIFTKQEFEAAIPKECLWKCIGAVQGEYAYLLHFGNPYALIHLRSSVAPNNVSRGTGEDSIRAWVVGVKEGISEEEFESKDFETQVIGAKTQKYVTRVKGWQVRMLDMLQKLSNVGLYVQPCPVCSELLRIGKGKGENKDKVTISCWTKENGNFANHVPLTWVDVETGETVESQKTFEAKTPDPVVQEGRKCPVCNGALRKVEIKKGSNAGKQAWTCPAMANGRYLNHIFEVIQENKEDEQEYEYKF